MSLPFNIDDLVNARTVESSRIEFKKGWNPEEIIHSICAFANDINEIGSGYVIVGIEEKDGVASLPPHGIEDDQVDKIQKEIVNLCHQLQPNYFPVVEPVIFQEKYIIVIWVSSGEDRPYSAPSTLGGKAQRKIYVRPFSANIVASPVLEARLRELSSTTRFDERCNINASISDLDVSLVHQYLNETKSLLLDEIRDITFEKLLFKMQIVKEKGGQIRPLNVGLMLFCKRPEIFFVGCRTNIVEFSDEHGTAFSEKVFSGPVHLQIRQILSYLEAYIIKKFTKKIDEKSEAITFFNYPFPALEEAVVNALYHRSYENSMPNEIRIYNNGLNRRINIISYPGPMPPIDQSSLLQLNITARNYRNLRLGEFLKSLKLAEKYATGIPRMISALKSNESPPPILTTDEERTFFIATIEIHPDTPFEAKGDFSRSLVDRLTNQQQLILEFVRNEPVEEFRVLDYFKEEITTDLDFLLNKGYLKIKTISNTNLMYVTPLGQEALRVSF